MAYFLIKYMMGKWGMGVEELSERTGVSYFLLEDLCENKIKNVSIEKLTPIAKFFKCGVEELYYTKGDYEKVRDLLHESIEDNGINHPETIRLSRILDHLLNQFNK